MCNAPICDVASAETLIVLQLETGERLQAKFHPSTTIWEILRYWEKQGKGNFTRLEKEGPAAKAGFFSKPQPGPVGYYEPIVVADRTEVIVFDTATCSL